MKGLRFGTMCFQQNKKRKLLLARALPYFFLLKIWGLLLWMRNTNLLSNNTALHRATMPATVQLSWLIFKKPNF